MTYPPDFPRKIVRPRNPKPEDRSLIVAVKDLIVVESMNDEVFPSEDLPTVLRNHEPAIVVCQGFGQHLQRLQRVYEHDPQFNYRVTPIHRYARPWTTEGEKRVEQGMIVDAVCNYVGWRAENKKDPNRYHYPLDPIWFLTAGIDDLDDRNLPRVVKLYEWAKQVRSWCAENELRIKASAGGLAAQLLKDPRFFPEARRKAPRLINDIARYRLPGNYYSLRGKTNHYYRAMYLDMENAHHALASRLSFPNVNGLHAYGNWSRDEVDSESPTREGTPFAPGDSPLLNCHGLLHCRIAVPHIPRMLFPPPYMERGGVRDVFLYTNELELVTGLGGEILGIHSAYVSRDTDPGLNKYARWAVGQIRKHPDYKPWLKPTLHASYGLLAARPSPFETGHFRAKGGERGEYHMGNVSLPVFIKRREREIETSIANVIHRGMIEAEVRKESLWFARFLTEVDRHHVLAIYADAIFIEDTGRPIRALQPPWRLSKYVTSLRFHSATHFTSPQLSRLPGVPATARERLIRSRELSEELARVPTLPPEALAAARNRNAVLRGGSIADGVPVERSKPRSVRRP